MSVPREGFPDNLPASVRVMLAELDERLVKPVVVLRRNPCQCWLGAVYRVPSGRVLLGKRRAVVQTHVDEAEAHLQMVAVDVDHLDVDFARGEFSCRHGSAAIDRSALLRDVDGATRSGTVHMLR